MQKDKQKQTGRRDGRMYQVSADRQSASRKVRYVEGSLPDQQGCRLCQGK